MRSRVSLQAKVGTNIVYAVLLVFYYWMWARRDWQDYYDVVQSVVIIFTVVFLLLQASRITRYGVDKKDEMAIQSLRKADGICLKIMIVVTAAIAFAGAVYIFDAVAAGYALVGAILAITVIRFAIFCVLDSKGIDCGTKDKNKGES